MIKLPCYCEARADAIASIKKGRFAHISISMSIFLLISSILFFFSDCGNSDFKIFYHGIASNPTNLTASAGDGQVTLTWNASIGATSYNIYESTTSGGPYTKIISTTNTNYTVTGLTNGATYYFVVTAVNSTGESGYSNQAGATLIPGAPTNLTATAGNGQVTLTWNAPIGATSYNVYESTTSGGPYTKINSTTNTNYTVTGLTNGATYYFVVTAVNSTGESGYSNQAGVTLINLTASAGDGQVTLTWNASIGATSYNIYESTTSGGPYTKINSTANTNYTVTGLTNGATYYFVVTAVNSTGESGYSNQAGAMPIAVPTNLAATAGNGQVTLTWNASIGATSYNVYESTTSGGPYTKINSTTNTNYTVTGLTNGATYYFVVTAVNSTGESGYSNEVSATPVPCSYSINPTGQSFTFTGGSGSISVIVVNGCNWNATSNVSWITITSGSSGSGNGTVNYLVAANTGASCQYGTITVAGNTFIVTQAGTSGSCLANSVWPKFHGNMQNTGLSSIDTSADTGTPKWSYTTGGEINSSPAIGADGTIYVGSDDNKLYAINPNGTLKWSYTTGYSMYSSPAIGADGTIYVGFGDKLYAINPNGTLKWSYTTGGGIDSSPAIGADGTIYVGSYDNKLYAINPNGTLKWSYTTGYWIDSSPAIGADGTIYVGSDDNKLYAINPNGTLKWSYTTGYYMYSSPAIGADGTIYVGSRDNKLYAINPDGGLKWSFTTGNWIDSSPAIGADGTIYVGSGYKLYAINPNGTLKWSYTTGYWIESSPAIGADGTIYVGSYDNKLYAISPSGTLKWSYTTGNWIADSSPAIGADGTIYVGSHDYNLYAIH